MATPNMIFARRLSSGTRLRLQVLWAKAFEALVETHCRQAAAFVQRLNGRLSVEQALNRYVREVGVPAPMEETVRARALIAVAPLIVPEPVPEQPAEPGWTLLRPDQVITSLRRRARCVEETTLDCRVAASQSDEAVAATHASMALEAAELLANEVPPDEAIMLYVRTFDLPGVEAQLVFRRALAGWAERQRPHPAPDQARKVSEPARILRFGGRRPLGLPMTG